MANRHYASEILTLSSRQTGNLALARGLSFGRKKPLFTGLSARCIIWLKDMKDIKGFEKYYAVTQDGVVYSLPRYLKFNHGLRLTKLKAIKQNIHKTGYRHVMLWKDWNGRHFLVHRLVANAFIPNPKNKTEVNHIDGDKSNNRANNLEWCTRSENMIHAHKKGLFKRKKPRV